MGIEDEGLAALHKLFFHLSTDDTVASPDYSFSGVRTSWLSGSGVYLHWKTSMDGPVHLFGRTEDSRFHQ